MANSNVIKEFVKRDREDRSKKQELGFEESTIDSVLLEGFKELTSDDNLYYKAVTSKGLAFEISRGEVYSSLVESKVMMSLINNIRRNSISVSGRGREDIIKMATSGDMGLDDYEEDSLGKTIGDAMKRGFGKA